LSSLPGERLKGGGQWRRRQRLPPAWSPRRFRHHLYPQHRARRLPKVRNSRPKVRNCPLMNRRPTPKVRKCLPKMRNDQEKNLRLRPKTRNSKSKTRKSMYWFTVNWNFGP
jgi:hypothetical protein